VRFGRPEIRAFRRRDRGGRAPRRSQVSQPARRRVDRIEKRHRTPVSQAPRRAGRFRELPAQARQELGIRADSLTVTFALRDDVAWSDGAPVTAHDVRFTWELEIDTLVAWPNRSVKERIADVEVVDDYTVRFRFAERYPYQLMDANDGVILPKHVLGGVPRAEIRECAFGRAPLGNGPYKLARGSRSSTSSSRETAATMSEGCRASTGSCSESSPT